MQCMCVANVLRGKADQAVRLSLGSLHYNCSTATGYQAGTSDSDTLFSVILSPVRGAACISIL